MEIAGVLKHTRLGEELPLGPTLTGIPQRVNTQDNGEVTDTENVPLEAIEYGPIEPEAGTPAGSGWPVFRTT